MFEVYTMDLVFQRAIEHGPPEFPRLNVGNLLGLSLVVIWTVFRAACFTSIYEDMDATPVSGQALRTQVAARFFCQAG